MEAGTGEPLDDAEFDRLARSVFAAQFDGCPPFRSFCQRRGRTPETVAHWTEVPAVPTAAFKDVELRSDDAPVERVFETSGTTLARPGRHELSARALDLYRASMVPTLRRYLLPELETTDPPGRSALIPVALAPSSEDAPRSSLSFMIDGACATLCSAPVRHLLGPGGLDVEELCGILVEAERQGLPLLLLGTSLAFLAACEALAARDTEFYLPEGSRVMETGGSKGREREIAPGEIRARIGRVFGVPDSHVVNEYGMTEACSQFYDGTLRESWLLSEAGTACAFEVGADRAPRAKHGPSWARAVVCDPETLEPVEPGKTGVLRLVDLANRFTISFLQTEDLAECPSRGARGPGSAPFVLRGRARGAEARGCSLAAEEWARATGKAS